MTLIIPEVVKPPSTSSVIDQYAVEWGAFELNNDNGDPRRSRRCGRESQDAPTSSSWLPRSTSAKTTEEACMSVSNAACHTQPGRARDLFVVTGPEGAR